jgi:hypothetical protein
MLQENINNVFDSIIFDDEKHELMLQENINNVFDSIIFDDEKHESIWGIRPDRVKLTQSLSLNDIVKHFHKEMKCTYCGADKNVRVIALDSNPENFLISNLECMCKSCFDSRFLKTTTMQVSLSITSPYGELVVTIERPLDRITGFIVNKIKYVRQTIHDSQIMNSCNPISTVIPISAEIYLMQIWKYLAQNKLLKGIIKIELSVDRNKVTLTSEAMQTFIMNNVSDIFRKQQKSSIIL